MRLIDKEKGIKERNAYCEYGGFMIVSADLISSSFDEDEYGEWDYDIYEIEGEQYEINKNR